MEGNFLKILRQAFHLTKGYKFFWLLGLFLVWFNFFRALVFVTELGNRLGWSNFEEGERLLVRPETVSTSTWIGIASLIFVTLAVIFYFRSKGALISAVSQLRNRKALDKQLVYSESEPHTVKLMKVGFGLMALMLLIGALLISPVVYLSSHDYSTRALTLGLLAAVIYLPIFCLLYYTAIFTPMFIVLQNMTTGGGLRASFDLIRRFWPTLLAFSLLLLVIEFALILLTLALMAVSVLPFVLLLNVFYDMEGQGSANIVQGLAIITGFVVFFISMGLVAGFQRIAWTIAFFEISKPVKLEEAAPAETLPEIIA